MIHTLARWKYRLALRVKLLVHPQRFTKHIYVNRKGGVGDVLMMTPALRGLRSKFPHARIVVETDYPELFELNPYVDQAVRSAQGMHFERCVVMRYEDHAPYREHITDLYCRHIGVPPQGRTLDLFFSVAEHRQACQRLRVFEKPLVTIQPWPGAWTHNKDWSHERWEQVVRALQALDLVVIQLGDLDESLIAGAVDWRGQTTLREAALTIKYASVHLTCNSSSEQFAHAVGTPAVVLYGTTHPVISSYPEQVALYGGTSALPCYHRELCEHRADMLNIQASDVIEAARILLTQRHVVEVAGGDAS